MTTRSKGKGRMETTKPMPSRLRSLREEGTRYIIGGGPRGEGSLRKGPSPRDDDGDESSSKASDEKRVGTEVAAVTMVPDAQADRVRKNLGRNQGSTTAKNLLESAREQFDSASRALIEAQELHGKKNDNSRLAEANLDHARALAAKRKALLNLAEAEVEFETRGREFYEEKIAVLNAEVALAQANYDLSCAKYDAWKQPGASMAFVVRDEVVRELNGEVMKAREDLGNAIKHLRDAKATAEANIQTVLAYDLQKEKNAAVAVASLTIPVPVVVPNLPGFYPSMSKDDVNQLNLVWWSEEDMRSMVESTRGDAFFKVMDQLSKAEHGSCVVANTRNKFYLKKDIRKKGYAPDIAILAPGGDPKNPTTVGTVAIGDMKVSDEPLSSDIEQLYRYALVLLDGDVNRSEVWTFLINLRKVTFFLITRKSMLMHVISQYSPLDCTKPTSDGSLVLLTFLRTRPEHLGYTLMFLSPYREKGVHFDELVGQGAEGFVFRASIKIENKEKELLVKIPRGASLDREKETLRSLAIARGVPQLAMYPQLQEGILANAMFMETHGEHAGLTVQGACELVDILTEVHARSYLHRDVRPSNIVTVETAAGSLATRRAILIDFGAAVKIGTIPVPYAGTVTTASDGVLTYLSQYFSRDRCGAFYAGYVPTRSDDYVSLVRSLLLLSFPRLRLRINNALYELGKGPAADPSDPLVLFGRRARNVYHVWKEESNNKGIFPEAAVMIHEKAIMAAMELNTERIKECIHELYYVAGSVDPWKN